MFTDCVCKTIFPYSNPRKKALRKFSPESPEHTFEQRVLFQNKING